MNIILSLGLICVLGGSMGQTAEDAKTDLDAAYFSGGCFWCLEAEFEKLTGVKEVISGYTGGDEPNPNYHQVASGKTGHREAVKVVYDPGLITYRQLLLTFWSLIDPSDAGGSFADRGPQYTSAIYYQDQAKRELAEASKHRIEDSGLLAEPIATSIEPLKGFYPAEDYHQDYHQRHSGHFQTYKALSGRDKYLKDWRRKLFSSQGHAGTRLPWSSFVKPAAQRLKQRLSELQFKVTQKDGTEPPFANEFWDHKQEGIYVDIVSGEPLFSSQDKFDSGTGWPSFTRPIDPESIVTRKDRSLLKARTEVRSRYADSHLGHVFSDGPKPTGLRYCINSAALRFVPSQELTAQGYAEYQERFED